MKIDITSMFFNSTLVGKTATPAWGTSIGQSNSRQCRIDSEKEGVADFVIGMTYRLQTDRENLDISKGTPNRELMLFSYFDKVFLNGIRLKDATYTLTLSREKTASHNGRLMVSFAPYIKYHDIENSKAVDLMRKQLNCSENGCWFVYDITIKNQDELHFSAMVVDKDSPMVYTCSSRERSNQWGALVLEKEISLESATFDYNSLIEEIKKTGLIYSEDLIERFVCSLMAKPFVILSGLAGSGKTQLALAFSKCMSEHPESQVLIVSVGADWTNREPLLGYPNALKNDEYVKPESQVLDLLINANKDPYHPYFLILDEMNLSVVERYFADFLSAMESKEPISLWKGNEDTETDPNKVVPKEICLPKNVFIIGTINVDETTYMFSPKVLDRANVIEFKISNEEMGTFLKSREKADPSVCTAKCADMAVDFVKKATEQLEVKSDSVGTEVLQRFFEKLRIVNAEFGYRSVNEIYRYIVNAEQQLGKDVAMDTAILQKLLPKLHGSRKKLSPVLSSLWELCFKENAVPQNLENVQLFDEVKEKLIYKNSAEKIWRMYHAVIDNGFTSYAEA